MNSRALFPYQPSWLRWVGGPVGVLYAMLVSQLVGDTLELLDTGNIYVDVPGSLLIHLLGSVVVLGTALSAIGHARARLTRTR